VDVSDITENIEINGQRFNPESVSTYMKSIASKHTRNSSEGILFNNYKKTHYMQPDMVGVITVEGRKLKIAGWLELDKEGGHCVRLSAYEPKNEVPEMAKPKKPKYKWRDPIDKDYSENKLFE